MPMLEDLAGFVTPSPPFKSTSAILWDRARVARWNYQNFWTTFAVLSYSSSVGPGFNQGCSLGLDHGVSPKGWRDD